MKLSNWPLITWKFGIKSRAKGTKLANSQQEGADQADQTSSIAGLASQSGPGSHAQAEGPWWPHLRDYALEQAQPKTLLFPISCYYLLLCLGEINY